MLIYAFVFFEIYELISLNIKKTRFAHVLL